MAAQDSRMEGLVGGEQAQPGGNANFQQGQATDFGGAATNFDDDAYGGKGPTSAFPTMEVHSGESSTSRSLGITFVGKKWLLALHQPIYRDMDNQPAQILKLVNIILAILILMGAVYRFIASFYGSVVSPYCDPTAFAKEFCPANNPDNTTCTFMGNATGAETQEQVVDCSWVMAHVVIPGDGFEIFVVSCFIVFFGLINLLEEFSDARVQWMMGPLSFMGTLHGRGLYLLFISALMMSHSHTFLMVVTSLSMAGAFGYLVIAGLSRWTDYGERLGVHSYQRHVQSDELSREGEQTAV